MRALLLVMLFAIAVIGWGMYVLIDNRRRRVRIRDLEQVYNRPDVALKKIAERQALETYREWGASIRVLQRILDQDPMITILSPEIRRDARAAVGVYNLNLLSDQERKTQLETDTD